MSKTVIVGATGAVGKALAAQLFEQNKEMYLVARDEGAVAELAHKFNAGFAVADVTDETALAEAIAAAGEDVNALVYAVGSIQLKSLRAAQTADLQETLKVNVNGAFIAVKAAQNVLKKNEGCVVLFSSVAARRGFMNHSLIGTAKAAVEGLTVALAAELAPQVRVNCIAPSLTPSKMAEPILSNEKMREAIAAQHPLKTLGDAEKTAALAAFLVSDLAANISGQVLAVDGGRSTLEVR